AAEPVPLRVGKVKKCFVGARRGERRVVEFMPAYRAAGSPERAVDEKPRLPVAQMQLAHREACRVSKKADHGVAYPLRVLKAFAEHHVAAALAVHRAGRCKSPQPLLEAMGVCEHARI